MYCSSSNHSDQHYLAGMKIQLCNLKLLIRTASTPKGIGNIAKEIRQVQLGSFFLSRYKSAADSRSIANPPNLSSPQMKMVRRMFNYHLLKTSSLADANIDRSIGLLVADHTKIWKSPLDASAITAEIIQSALADEEISIYCQNDKNSQPLGSYIVYALAKIVTFKSETGDLNHQLYERTFKNLINDCNNMDPDGFMVMIEYAAHTYNEAVVATMREHVSQYQPFI